MGGIPKLLGTLTAASLSVVAMQATAQIIAWPGVSDPVEIIYDDQAVPHIYAANKLDAAFAQGFAHAEQRFWQMDYTRRAASGTLGEMLGQAALSNDIQLRTLGLRRAAWETFSQLPADMRARLQAYANGVNAWLATNELPPEYGVLELSSADPWTPVDSVVVGKILAFQLSFDLDIDATIALGTYQAVGEIAGFDGTALFFEDTYRSAPPDDRVTVPGFLDSIGGVGKSATVPAADALKSSNVQTIDPQTVAALKDLKSRLSQNPWLEQSLRPAEKETGSNWWMVDAAHSANGSAMIASDPHLGLDTPAIWHESHISVGLGSEDLNVSGMGLAGVPGIVLGCNNRDAGEGEEAGYCWGATVNPTDVTDVFQDNVLVNTFGLPTHTVHSGEKERILWVFQSYFVNNIGDGEMDNLARAPVGYDEGGLTFIVPRRNNGPILDFDAENGTAFTVQFTGWGATRELQAFTMINEGETIDDFYTAIQHFDFGTQNFSVATTDGDIAYFAGSEVPVRDDLQNLMAPDGGIPPFLIRDGSGALRHEWMPVTNPQPYQAVPYEILPQAELPHVINPASGYIANGNNDPIGTTLDNNPLNQVRPGGGLYYQNPGFTSLRMGRIDRVLQAALADDGLVSAQEMIDLQANNQLLDAELVMPHVMTAFENAMAGDAWPGVAQFLLDPQVTEAIARLAEWDFSTPTGIQKGYDPGDNPFLLPEPDLAQINNSVAATLFAVWRGQFVKNTIDATLDALQLGGVRPGSSSAYNAMIHQLEVFDQQNGFGVSGVPFFNVPEAPDMASARDFIILFSLREALDLLASDEFAPAFGNSTNIEDYRWGYLHRIVFDHPMGDIFSLPNGLYGLTTVNENLPGVARHGGYQAVDASSHSSRADGLNDFMFGSGASRRLMATMDPGGVQALHVYAGGQSGELGDPAYASQLYPWLVNAYKELLFSRDEVEDVAVSTITFVPYSAP